MSMEPHSQTAPQIRMGVFMKDVNLKDQDTILVWGTKGADTVVASTAWGEGINAYDFGLPSYYNPSESKEYKTDQIYKLYVTLDRPIYRPGQKVYFKRSNPKRQRRGI